MNVLESRTDRRTCGVERVVEIGQLEDPDVDLSALLEDD